MLLVSPPLLDTRFRMPFCAYCGKNDEKLTRLPRSLDKARKYAAMLNWNAFEDMCNIKEHYSMFVCQKHLCLGEKPKEINNTGVFSPSLQVEEDPCEPPTPKQAKYDVRILFS